MTIWSRVSNRVLFLFTAFAVFFIFVAAQNVSAATVTLSPGDDIQSKVNANPAGTTYLFNAGTYRMQSITPKSGDIYDGQGQAILNGSRVLSGWTQSGSTWYVGGQTQQGNVHGECMGQTGDAYPFSAPMCKYPEDLYVDNVPQTHVSSLSQVGPGKWYFDYGADRVYMGTNPSGHTVEIGVTPRAFGGGASNVTVKRLTIEKYATPVQEAVVAAPSNWTISDNVIRLNHAIAVDANNGTKVLRNKLINNGMAGYGGGGDGMLFESNEIGNNGYAGVAYLWEGGGGKLTENSSGVVIRNNCVYDNRGPGIWMDIDSNNVLVENNVVWGNWDNGIMYEISTGGIIRNNLVANNGAQEYGTGRQWFWSPQILISAADNVQVYGNTIDNNTAANAITIVNQGRGGAYDLATGSRVYNNIINLRTTNANTVGGTCDGCSNANSFFSGNTFDHNTYHVASLSHQYWSWKDNDYTLSGMQSIGQESGSTVDGNLPAAPALNCNFLSGVTPNPTQNQNNTTPAPTVTVSVTPTSISSGGSATVSWSSTNATSCTASGSWSGSKSTSGSQTVTNITANQTYTLSCIGNGGTNSGSASVTVTGSSNNNTSAKTIPGTIQAEDYDQGGEGVGYHDSDATNSGGQYRTDGVDIKNSSDTGGGYAVGWVMQAGEWLRYTVNVTQAGTYTFGARLATPLSGKKFHVEIDGVNVTGSLDVPVTGADWDQTWGNVTKTGINLTAGQHTMKVVADTDLFDYNYFTWTLASASQQTAPTVTLAANAASVSSGGSATLSWSSTNATSCTASGGWDGSKAVSGSQTLSNLTTTKTYSLSCTGAGGTSNTSATIQVIPITNTAPTVTISASPTTVTTGGSSIINWSSTNATSCTASGAWSGSKSTSGSQGVSNLTTNQTYTLSCTGAGGTTSNSTMVAVNASNNQAPVVSLNVSPTSVTPGGAATLTWSSANANSCIATGGWSGAKAISGSETLYNLNTSITYGMTCSGVTGSASASTHVSVTGTTPTPSYGKFVIGDRVVTTDAVRVRPSPTVLTLSATTQRLGAQGTVVEGPVTYERIVRWKVDFDTGSDGWVAEDYLRKGTGTSVPSDADRQAQIAALYQLLNQLIAMIAALSANR